MVLKQSLSEGKLGELTRGTASRPLHQHMPARPGQPADGRDKTEPTPQDPGASVLFFTTPTARHGGNGFCAARVGTHPRSARVEMKGVFNTRSRNIPADIRIELFSAATFV